METGKNTGSFGYGENIRIKRRAKRRDPFAALRADRAAGRIAPSEPQQEQNTGKRLPPWLYRALIIAVDVVLLAAMLTGAFMVYDMATVEDTRLFVVLRADGLVTRFHVYDMTVRELLALANIKLRETDEVSRTLDETVEDGMIIDVTRAFPVAVTSDGETGVYYFTGGTVGDALREAGVEFSIGDELSHLPYADLEPGMEVVHTNVEMEYVTTYKTLEYREEVIKDESRYIGDESVEQEGKDGLKQITQRIVIKNGVEASREVVDQVIITPAIDQITRVGIKIRYQTSYVGEWRVYKKKPTAGKDGWVKMSVYRITGYCAGTRTATGTRPKLGTIAVNPKLIPYGTEIWVDGYGYGVARDTGAFRNYPAPKNTAIDLWFNTEKEARRWGSKYNRTILVKMG